MLRRTFENFVLKIFVCKSFVLKFFVLYESLTCVQLLTTCVENIFACLIFVLLGKYNILNNENFPIFNDKKLMYVSH